MVVSYPARNQSTDPILMMFCADRVLDVLLSRVSQGMCLEIYSMASVARLFVIMCFFVSLFYLVDVFCPAHLQALQPPRC